MSLTAQSNVVEPAQPNWELAHSLYSQGLQLAEVAKQARVSFYALKKRIQRGNWRLLKDQVTEATATIEITEKGQSTAASDRIKQAVADRIEAHVSVLSGLRKPRGLSGIMNELQVLALIISNGKTLFGWGDNNPNVALNISLMKSARILDKGNLTASQSVPIDIPSQIVAEQRPAEPLSTEQTPPDART